ncbi:dynacortin [Tieghemostelium lacteum]|uniref:Dynacortin n=1 Tax=Tieghemostelium lacteum TaxID=361077 RepID=A0A151ZAH9_TIELA|nr:dynacortin [Tieghemostelium lacteum]|eukprot:KYQ90936.1 dynacortin [Tieghemostelium lacteum]
MSTLTPEEQREEQRLNKALSGKLNSQQGKTRPISSKWEPVNTKSIPGIPVNSTSSNNLNSDFGKLSVGVSSGVDTSSPYSGVVGVTPQNSVSDEKLKQEQQRLKKWGLSSEEDSKAENIPTYQSLNSSQGLNKSPSVTFNANGDIVYPNTPTKVTNSTSQENLVDSTSIMSNVDSHTSQEKMSQEAKRLERWGLKINTNSISSGSSNTSSTSSTPAQTSTTPQTQSIPSSPFTTSASQSVATTNKESGLQQQQVQQFLDRVVFSAKSVKLILHKKSTNFEGCISILMELVKESATFGISLNPENPMSFDISQNAGKLAGAVNEFVIKSSQSDYNPKSILEEIQSLLGLLFLAVAAN